MAHVVKFHIADINRIMAEQYTDLIEWLDLDHNENPEMNWDQDRMHCSLVFQSEEEAATFKLRWCGQ